jgi:alanyl-tRNA synthetase
MLTMSPDLEQRLSAAGDDFAGYEATSVQGTPILALFDAAGASVQELGTGATGYVALGRTPFYIEAGGQVSDSGRLFGADAEARVERMVRQPGGRPRLHQVTVTAGRLRQGQIVTAEVADAVRDATRRNHTATHLLHAALREVLGSHVKQAGSLVSPDRLRFDFVHFAPMTRDQLDRVEAIVNAQIVQNTAVQTEVRATEEAIATGAMALFGEKYGDRVRVVTVPGFSVELCGGTHVRATGDIGAFLIVEEAGVAAGVRRVEAVTGSGAITRIQEQRALLDQVLKALNSTPAQAVDLVGRLQADVKRLTREVDQVKMKMALTGGSAAAESTAPTTVAGIKVATQRADGLEKAALRGLSDSLRDRLGSGVVVIASETAGKVTLVVSVTKDLTSRVQAGRLVKELAPIVGGGGGGRPDFAEAGGKDASRIDDLFRAVPEVLQKLLA